MTTNDGKGDILASLEAHDQPGFQGQGPRWPITMELRFLRRAIDEIKRLRAQSTMRAETLATVDAENERLRADHLKYREFAEHLVAFRSRMASRWRALARKRREQVRELNSELQATFRAHDRERDRRKALERALDGVNRDVAKAERERDALKADLSRVTAELTSERDLAAAELQSAAEGFNHHFEQAAQREHELEADRDRAIQEALDLGAQVKERDGELTRLTRERDEARAEAVDLENRDERLHEAGEMVFEMARQQTQIRVERDRARELLASTEAQANEHLRARLRAEVDLRSEMIHSHDVREQLERARAEIEDLEKYCDEESTRHDEHVYRLGQELCGANWQIGMTEAERDHWLEQCRRVTSDLYKLRADHLSVLGQCMEEHTWAGKTS